MNCLNFLANLAAYIKPQLPKKGRKKGENILISDMKIKYDYLPLGLPEQLPIVRAAMIADSLCFGRVLVTLTLGVSLFKIIHT